MRKKSPSRSLGRSGLDDFLACSWAGGAAVGHPRFQNPPRGREDLPRRGLWDLGSRSEPLLDVPPAEFGAGEPERLAADECNGLRFRLGEVARNALLRGGQNLGGMAEQGMPDLVEEGLHGHWGNWRNRHLPPSRV